MLAGAGRLRTTTRPDTNGVRVADTSRLRVLESMLPKAHTLTIYADDAQQASSWVLDFPAMRLTLALSAEVWRGFSGEGQALRALMKAGDAPALAAVRAQLNWQDALDTRALSAQLSIGAPEVEDALRILGCSGLAGYDAGRADVWPFNDAVFDHLDLLAPASLKRLANDLARERPSSIHRVQRLVIEGWSDRPDCDEYVIGLMTAGYNSRLGATPLLSMIDADPGLLDGPILRLFEVEGSGDMNMAGAEKYTGVFEHTWTFTLPELVKRGAFTRSRMMAEAVVRREPELTAAASALAVAGLAHESVELQKKIIARIAQWGVAEEGRAALVRMLPHVAAANRAALAPLAGEGESAVPAPAPAPAPAQESTQEPDPALAAAAPQSPVDPSRRLAKLDGMAQLVQAVAQVLEDDSDPDGFESALDGVARIAPFDLDAMTRFAPVIQRACRRIGRPLSAALARMILF